MLFREASVISGGEEQGLHIVNILRLCRKLVGNESYGLSIAIAILIYSPFGDPIP